MLTEDNRVGRWEDRSAVHVLLRHGIELLELGDLPFVPVGKFAELAPSETTEGLFSLSAMGSGIEGPNHEAWETFVFRESGDIKWICDGLNNTELIHGQMEGLVEMSIRDRDVAFRREDDFEITSVGGSDGLESGNNLGGSENSGTINRDHISADIFASDIADSRGGCARNNGRNVASSTNMAFGDVESERRVITYDSRGQGIQTVERIISDLEIHGRNIQRVGRQCIVRIDVA